jgi:hypothetical protein
MGSSPAIRPYDAADLPRITDICRNVCECVAWCGCRPGCGSLLHHRSTWCCQPAVSPRKQASQLCVCEVQQTKHDIQQHTKLYCAHPLCLCADGGTDTLPYAIQTQLADDPAATVLVAQPTPQQPVDGIGEQLSGNNRGLVQSEEGTRAAGKWTPATPVYYVDIASPTLTSLHPQPPAFCAFLSLRCSVC